MDWTYTHHELKLLQVHTHIPDLTLDLQIISPIDPFKSYAWKLQRESIVHTMTHFLLLEILYW